MSNIPGAPAANKTVATAQTASHATVGPLPDFVPLTPDTLLIFCASRLSKMDTAIAKKMADQNGLVALQGSISAFSSDLKKSNLPGSEWAFDTPEQLAGLNRNLDAAIKDAMDSGNGSAATVLNNVKHILNQGADGNPDSTVTFDEIKEMGTMLDSASTECRSGAEVSMIELQSLVSQRSTLLQLTTGMMNSINEGTKSIAGNIGR